MTEQPHSEVTGAARSDSQDDLLRRELERRLALLSEADDADFGGFTRLDWIAVIFLFFALPCAVALWWML